MKDNGVRSLDSGCYAGRGVRLRQLCRQTALGRCVGRSDEGAEVGAIAGRGSGLEEGFDALLGTEILRTKIEGTCGTGRRTGLPSVSWRYLGLPRGNRVESGTGRWVEENPESRALTPTLHPVPDWMHQAKISPITLPETFVSRASRPWNLKVSRSWSRPRSFTVSRVCSMPSNRSIVACRS